MYLCNIRRLYYLECCNIKMKTLVPPQNVFVRVWHAEHELAYLNVFWFRGFGADAGSPGKLLALCRLWWGGCMCLWWVSGGTRRWWLWAAVAQGRPRPVSHFPRSCWNKQEQREEALPVSASTSVFVAQSYRTTENKSPWMWICTQVELTHWSLWWLQAYKSIFLSQCESVTESVWICFCWC